MTPRGIKPVVREPVLTSQEIAAVPDDRPTIDPLLTLEEELARIAESCS